MSQSTEIDAALAANVAFYEAFAAGDVASMTALWATTVPAVCIHPGALPLLGRESVIESWHAVLAEPPEIRMSGARVTLIRGVAFVTCYEHIGENDLAAANAFVWEDGGWRLAFHQAGLVPSDAWPESGSSGTLH